VQAAFANIVPDDADPALVARAVVDPTQDGAAVGFAVTDRLRAEMLHRTGLDALLHPIIRPVAP
jgi:hypothetical protein